VHPSQVVVNSDTTLFPGTCCGGIYVKKGTATLSTGTYILVGGGIGTQNSNSNITGTGVFIYNTYSSSNSYAGIYCKANSTINLTAAAATTPAPSPRNRFRAARPARLKAPFMPPSHWFSSPETPV